MYRTARQTSRLQLVSKKLYTAAKGIDGSTAKWRWVCRDPRLLNFQMAGNALTPEVAQQKLICTQHRILVASFNLMQELVGRDPLETEVAGYEPFNETVAGIILSESEEMVCQLRERHVWSLKECKTLCSASNRLREFAKNYRNKPLAAERNMVIDMQYAFIKLITENLKLE